MAATGLEAPSPMRGCSEGQGPEETPKGRKEKRSRQQKGRNNCEQAWDVQTLHYS